MSYAMNIDFLRLFSVKSHRSIFSLIDRQSKVSCKAKINRLVRFYNSSIGKYSYIGPGTRVINSSIGSFCSISWNCQIGLASHSLTHISTSPIFFETKNGTGQKWLDQNYVNIELPRTHVGNDVWIGSGAIILQGLTIGDGAIVGAGAIVTKDVAPYSIVAGNPARLIRRRFKDDLCDLLISSKWWDMEDEALKRIIHLFQTPNPSVDTIKEIVSISAHKSEK